LLPPVNDTAIAGFSSLHESSVLEGMASAGMCRPSRDSPHSLSLSGTAVPGYRLFRPYGTALSRPVNDTAIAGFSSLHESSVLEGMASAGMCRPSRDSPHSLSLPGTAVPGYRLFRPYGTALLRPVNDTAIAGFSSLHESSVLEGRASAGMCRPSWDSPPGTL
jgi:hypothetical protein